MTNVDFDAFFGTGDAAPAASTGTKKPRPEPAPEPAVDPAAAAAAEAALTSAVDSYEALLPAIQAANPERGTVTVEAPLTGVAYAKDAWQRLLNDTTALGEWAVPPFGQATISGDGDAVTVTVTGTQRGAELATAKALVELAEHRGNLGRYVALPGDVPGTFSLVRRGVEDTSGGWASDPKTRAFYTNPQYRAGVWDRCGLTATDARSRALHPKPQFGSDDRGGTAALTLPPGLLPAKVVGAEQALRQALAMPELTVTVDGLRPVIHLNSRALNRDFPTKNPLRASMFTRPRTEAERYAAAGDFVLPLGVRADGSPLLISQDVVPHMGVFGGTGAGKTVLIRSLVDAAVLQGASVVLADAKNGKDLRALAIRARNGELPGVVHYAATSEAALHRAVLYVHDELQLRQALSQRLSQRDIEYQPAPMLFVFDEWGAWIDTCLGSKDKAVKAAAETTRDRMTFIASQAREFRIFILLTGQYAYVDALAGKLRASLKTLAVLGPPQSDHLQNLFDGERRADVKKLGATITGRMKGRGTVVVDSDEESGDVELFQGFYNAPGPDADALAAALKRAPAQRRFGWRFPSKGEVGGDGSWQSWTPVSDPSSDDLQTIWLDLPDGSPDPAAARYDPADRGYRPGTPPIHARHIATDE